MTLSEFKAWFEGFSENITGSPSEKQWKRVTKRVGEIDGESITPIYFERHYHRPYRQWWPEYNGPTWTGDTPRTWPTTTICQSGTDIQAHTSTMMFSAGQAEAASIQ